jgi:8-oxo-dGTP diphosphatase
MPEADSRLHVVVEAALFTLVDDRLCVALHQMRRGPFKGAMALVGGHVHPDEDADARAAITRILADKAGLHDVFLEQLQTFSGKDHDPRRWSVSITYYALAPLDRLAEGLGLQFVDVDRLPELAFDHRRIILAALGRLRRKGAYSNLPALLLAEEFTFPELKAVYEKVLGSPLNDSAFRRKITELKIIEPVPEARSPATAERKRPAQLYRLADRGLAEWDRTL